MKKNIEERINFHAREKLSCGCYIAISMSQNARTCNDRGICQICKKKHPSVLHGYTPKHKAGDDNSSASDGIQNVTFKSNCVKFYDASCSAWCSDEIVSLYIFPIKVRYVNKRTEVTTYALLDNCSQGTFVGEDIIYKLEASKQELR